MNPPSSVFQRLILPGFALKAVVIGGGYATGRELATFFLPSGPWGGLYGMLLSMLIWSVVCAVTFVFALQTRSLDYRTFFRHLLGPLWPIFEVSFALALVVILAVYRRRGRCYRRGAPRVASVRRVVAPGRRHHLHLGLRQ